MNTTKGDCYKAAYETVAELAQIRNAGLHKEKGWPLTELILVHGTVMPPVGPFAGKEIKHAWARVDGKILEMSNGNQHSYSEDQWENDYQAKEIIRYAPEEAAARAEESNHYGPWN
jgi:hypothetical protein